MTDLRHIDHDDPRMTPAAVEAFRADPLDVATTEIERYAESLPSIPDEVLLTRGRLVEFIARARELKAQIDAVLVRFIKAHGEITAGEIRYYVGAPKKEKCHDLPGALDYIFINVKGDFAQAVDFFSADPLKPGMFKKTLGDEAFAKVFTVTHAEEIREGKPVKSEKLIELNTKFLK